MEHIIINYDMIFHICKLIHNGISKSLRGDAFTGSNTSNAFTTVGQFLSVIALLHNKEDFTDL